MADADFAANIGWHCIHFRGSSPKYFTISERMEAETAQGSQERMKSRQHYILTISPSGNSTSLELVALLHDCFPPFTKELLCSGRGSRTFVAMRTLLRCTLATEPPISTINYKHKMDSSLASLSTTC